MESQISIFLDCQQISYSLRTMQDVGIEEVIEYGQEEIGNEGGTEQHVDTRELNMEGSDCEC